MPPSFGSSDGVRAAGGARPGLTDVGRRLLGLAAALAISSVWAIAPAHAGHGGMIPWLDAGYIKAQYDKGRRLTAVDLRSLEHFQKGHLPGARSLPLDELAARFEEVPRADLVVLYCDCAPVDIEEAYQFLRRKSYRNLIILEQGFQAWAQRGYPVEHSSPPR